WREKSRCSVGTSRSKSNLEEDINEMKSRMKKEVPLPVRVAEKTARLLNQAAADRPLTPQLKRKLSQAAAELEVRVRLAEDGQAKIPKKLTLVVLRCIAFLAHFHKEIGEAASALMGSKDK